MATREEIRALMERDWELVAAESKRWWREHPLAPIEAFRVADSLRAQAAGQPGWPSPADREADLATHVRVHQALVLVDYAAQR